MWLLASMTRSSHFTSLIGVIQVLILVLFDSSQQVAGSVIVWPSSTTITSTLQLKVVIACEESAILEWISQKMNIGPDSLRCELNYHVTGTQDAQILDIFLDPHSNVIKLYNLTEGENYSACMACDSLGRTNEVSFTIAGWCKLIQPSSNSSLVTSDSDKPIISSYTHSATFSTVEWPIAITLAVVGIIICAVVAFYMWKKYQRRQRILRIFRQGQNDPFQALYSPTQDSYSF